MIAWNKMKKKERSTIAASACLGSLNFARYCFVWVATYEWLPSNNKSCAIDGSCKAISTAIQAPNE